MALLNADGTINKREAFCDILQNTLPAQNILLTGILNNLDNAVLAANPRTSKQALSNAHGDWYEWLLAISAWNYHAANPNSYFALLLPNVSQFNVAQLYEQDLSQMIADLRAKLHASVNVQLITSNPDFVLIDADVIEVPPETLIPINVIDYDTVEMIDRAYRHFIHQCNYESIVGYLSIKSSLRPDRRLQISHEGSLAKALYTHMQTRQWILEPKGLKYYCCSTSVSDADRRGLRTVATHSITSVQSTPQAAVDDSFEVNSLAQAELMWRAILH